MKCINGQKLKNNNFNYFQAYFDELYENYKEIIKILTIKFSPLIFIINILLYKKFINY